MGNQLAGIYVVKVFLIFGGFIVAILPFASIFLFVLSQKDFPHNAHHREIAISVSNYTLKHGDSGLVIVGGRMEVQPHV